MRLRPPPIHPAIPLKTGRGGEVYWRIVQDQGTKIEAETHKAVMSKED